MLILPAIDLIDGTAVRLKKGAETTKKVYSNSPQDVAKEWEASGAQFIHVVNLDGAFGRSGKNTAAVENILRDVSIPVELGGGIRSYDDAKAWLDLGVNRVIFGTVAVTSPQLVKKAIDNFGTKKVVVGIDARQNKVAIEGWENQTNQDVLEFAISMKNMGVERIVYTDINRDGLLTGPNVENTAQLAKTTGLLVIASGGVSSVEHIQTLVDTNETQIEGVIIGTALYEKQIDLKQVIEIFQ